MPRSSARADTLPFRITLPPSDAAPTRTAEGDRSLFLFPLEDGIVSVTWWVRDRDAPATDASMDEAALKTLAAGDLQASAPPRSVALPGATRARRVDYTFAGGDGLIGAVVVAVRDPTAAFILLVAAAPESPAAAQLEVILGSFEVVAGVSPWT